MESILMLFLMLFDQQKERTYKKEHKIERFFEARN